MPELNKANRQVCDVDIRILKTLAPFLFFDTANTTTVGLSGDSVYAMKKGTRAIAFQNPIEGTMTIEAQVYPFKLFSLISDGVVETTGVKTVKTNIVASEEGKITLSVADNENVNKDSVFVYKVGEFGENAITGDYADGVFSSSSIKIGDEYEVGYIVNKTSGVKRVSFNNKKIPKDYFITMSTVDKDEEGTLTPFIITAYKASVQRNFELSFSSEGDPASISLTFDLMEDKNGNVLDMLEDTDISE